MALSRRVTCSSMILLALTKKGGSSSTRHGSTVVLYRWVACRRSTRTHRRGHHYIVRTLCDNYRYELPANTHNLTASLRSLAKQPAGCLGQTKRRRPVRRAPQGGQVMISQYRDCQKSAGREKWHLLNCMGMRAALMPYGPLILLALFIMLNVYLHTTWHH